MIITKEKWCSVLLAVLLGVSLSASITARADLLQQTIVAPQIQAVFGSELTYSESTDELLITAVPSNIIFPGLASRTIFPTDVGAIRSVQIGVLIDDAGNVVPGTTGPNLIVIGKVQLPNDSVVSGILLQGDIVDFGFLDLSTTPGATDQFNFSFTVTGGLVAGAAPGLYPLGGTAGVEVGAEGSTFANSFTEDFQATTPKLRIGVVEPELSNLGDRVWIDSNGNGIQDCVDGGANDVLNPADGVVGNDGDSGAECNTGVAGVTATLFSNPNGDNACSDGDEELVGGAITNPLTTDANGFYLFTDLPAGDYCVEFTDVPTGFVFTGQDISNGMANADTVDSDADTTTGRTGNVSLAAGDTDLSVDAGIYLPAKVGNQVWFDLDRDGIQDNVPGTEPGVAGVVVNLYRCEENSGGILVAAGLVATNGPAGTLSDGLYLFDNLQPGQYEVEFVSSSLPADREFTVANVGMNDAIDSDADAATGRTGCMIDLASGDDDRSWDAGIIQPLNSGLGDRLFHDLNANGLQDTDEPGIPGAIVRLLDPGPDMACDTMDDFEIDSTITSTNGLGGALEDGIYAFPNLAADRYCVQFEQKNICELNQPFSVAVFSPQNIGADNTRDSDVNPSTGVTGSIDLPAGVTDKTWDAGLYCPSKLGDQVWNDLDGNGLQDNVNGTGPDDEPGIDRVTVALQDCSGNSVNDADGNPVLEVFTDSTGMYMFNNLKPGMYRVRFGTVPFFVLTDPNVGSDDEIDSDAVPGSRLSECKFLPSDFYDDSIDAGFVAAPPCALDVQKTCKIEQVVTTNLTCDDVKPIDEIIMRWNDGTRVITKIDVYSEAFDSNNPNDNLIQTFNGIIEQGDVFTASGYEAANSPNDVDWVITFEDGSRAISRFHRSCSDDDMDGPEDCGKAAGDGKRNALMIDSLEVANTWAFEGLSGNGKTLACTSADPTPGTTSECTFESLAGPHCQGQVLELSLRYTGGACTISNNQEGRAECLQPGVAGDGVRIKLSDGGSSVYLDVAGVDIGDVVTGTAEAGGEDKFRSNTVLEIFSATGSLVQKLEFHTSCSKPLNLGDQFGAVTVVGIDTNEQSASLGADVQFDYTVTNPTGLSCVSGSLVDDQLGVIADPLGLGAMDSVSFTRQAFVLPDSSNTVTSGVTASCTLSDGTMCMGEASTTITRIPPATPPAGDVSCSDIKDITAVSLVWDGSEAVDVMAESGEFFAKVQPGNLITFSTVDLGNEVELALMNQSGAHLNASVHVSCSDDDMDGSEDCGSAQGNSKDNDSSKVNTFLFAGMDGENGSIECPLVPNTGEVLGTTSGGGSGGSAGSASATAKPTLKLSDDKVEWELENTGSVDLFVVTVEITWPLAHGTLEKVKLDGDFAKDVDDGDGSTTLVLADFEADDSKRRLKQGDRRKIEFEFSEKFQDNSPADYTIKVTFTDGVVLEYLP